MKNYVQEGKTITVTVLNSNGVKSGDLLVVGALIGVAAFDAAGGHDVEIATEGVFELRGASLDEIDTGDLLYFDIDEVTKVGNETTPLVGVAVEPKAALGIIVKCKLGAFGLVGPEGT